MTDNEINELIATMFFEQPKPPYSRSSHIDPVGNGAWVCQTEHRGKGSLCNWQPLSFVSDPAACALVKAELRRRGWWYRLTNTCHPGTEPIEFRVIRDRNRLGHAYADTEERAVCLAALAAIGE